MVNCGMRYNVKELLVLLLTHKEHYYYYTWIEYKKGTLGFGDSGKAKP
jgi:hypothetical protein